jgi:hypothetical protein
MVDEGSPTRHVLYDSHGRGWLLPASWSVEEVWSVIGDVRRAHLLADSRGQVLEETDRPHSPLGQLYMPSSRATLFARIRLPNWPFEVSVNGLLHLADAEGLPVAWVPDPDTLRQWLRAPDYDARIDLLEVRAHPVLTHSRQVLSEVTTCELSALRALLEEAELLARRGYTSGSQALATVALTTLIEQTLGSSLGAARRRTDTWRRTAGESVQCSHGSQSTTHVGAAAANLAYTAALAQNHPPEAVPSRYNRHASVHRAGREQYTPANALIAYLLAVSLLRQSHSDRDANSNSGRQADPWPS